jgi:proteasome lid subunit RPN8/RPN11
MRDSEAGVAVAGRIRLVDDKRRMPTPSFIPYHHARRWISPFEGAATPALPVFITPRAYVRLCAHAGTDLENEVGGAVVGTWRLDRGTGRPFIVVEAALRALHTRHGGAFLTFTHDSLVHLHSEIEARHPGKVIVGWFHTHPGLGVFLSDYDRWLHEHFFPEPWQVALVIDPVAVEGGVFTRNAQGELDVHRYTGFHELKTRAGEGVVHWRNLLAADGAGG